MLLTLGTFLRTPFESISRWTARSPTSPTACLPLDLSSPQFADRLNNALHSQEYAQCVENFREDDLVWFVDYLDKARQHAILSHWMLKLASRLSKVSILRVPLPESVYVNLEVYARLIRRSQHPIQFHRTFLPLIPIRSPPVASARCIMGPLMAHQFVSNVCEWLPRKTSS